jgi:CRP/FNR family transcriptional regulator
MTPDALERKPIRLAAPAAGPRKVVALRSGPALPCASCSTRSVCACDALGEAVLREFGASFGAPVRLAKREALFRAGQPFTALYAVRRGTFKTIVRTGDGREQITDYHMAGSMLGLDGLGQGHHACDAVALEDSEACPVPYAVLDALARDHHDLQHLLLRLVAETLQRAQSLILLLGHLSAEERIAAYLVGLAERNRARGYSPSEFLLRMTRDEIASYLGLQLETVSRGFSRLHNDGVIQVQGRDVKLLDPLALKRLAGGGH